MNDRIRSGEGRPARLQVGDVQRGNLVIGLQVRTVQIPSIGQLRCDRPADPAGSPGQHHPSFRLSHSGNPKGRAYLNDVPASPFQRVRSREGVGTPPV